MPAPSILAVFAHPDDETSCFAALMKRYTAEGKDIHIITATKGEVGALGTGGMVIKREDLPAVREAEQRAVLQMLGVTNPPNYLGYRDGDMDKADQEVLTGQVLEIMRRVEPDVIIAFGPTGLSHHVDHIAMHHATLAAFERYRKAATKEVIYYYWALAPHVIAEFELDINGPEIEPHVTIDVSDTWAFKIKALRMYASQEDAQEIAEMLDGFDEQCELFHQVYPPVPASARFDDLFHA